MELLGELDAVVLAGPSQEECRVRGGAVTSLVRLDEAENLGQLFSVSGRRSDDLSGNRAHSFSDCTSYEFELLEAEVLGDVANTVGFEHTSASVNGVPSNYTLRATQLYRREDGEWKVAHRHGSAPPD